MLGGEERERGSEVVVLGISPEQPRIFPSEEGLSTLPEFEPEDQPQTESRDFDRGSFQDHEDGDTEPRHSERARRDTAKSVEARKGLTTQPSGPCLLK